jgi:hypothetical protein
LAVGPRKTKEIRGWPSRQSVSIEREASANFPGADRWLQLEVRTNGGSAFTALAPRQQLTATPYAITAGNVTGPINGSSIVGGTITGAQLANGAVTALNIASNSITSGQLANGAAAGNLNAGGQSGVASGGIILSSNANSAELLNAGYVKLGRAELGERWQARGLATAPSARSSHTAVWTGTEMIVWGGYGVSANLNDGGRYDPALNTWTSLATGGAPSPRTGHAAIWNGGEMIVWGGTDGTAIYADGARYNPVSNQWLPIPASPLMAARTYHTAIWSGTEMIVWGGLGSNSVPLNTGGRFASTWRTNTSLINAPAARYVHRAVWTGTKMIVWGGAINGSSFLNTGAQYDPLTDSWATMPMWTGSEMIVWGGSRQQRLPERRRALQSRGQQLDGGAHHRRARRARIAHGGVDWQRDDRLGRSGRRRLLNDGGRYNPAANSWTALPTTGAPAARWLITRRCGRAAR